MYRYYLGGGCMNNLLQLKGHAALLIRKRKALERVILDAAVHTDGCLVEKYRKCGNPRCKCAQGELHGPALYISRRVEGKTRYDYVPKDKVDLAKVLVGRHTKLYRARARIQKINRDLNGIFDQIVELNRIEFPKKTEKGEEGTDGEPTGS
jgi:hypothetical protein